MKIKFILFTFVSLILLFSCNKKEITTDTEFEIEKSFKINDVYQSNSNSLKFKITEINDSRCPSDVTCVWEGKADVSIQVESPVVGNIVLSTINNGFDQTTDTIGNFSFQLIEVSPYPISTQTINLEDYQVKLKVKNLNL